MEGKKEIYLVRNKSRKGGIRHKWVFQKMIKENGRMQALMECSKCGLYKYGHKYHVDGELSMTIPHCSEPQYVLSTPEPEPIHEKSGFHKGQRVGYSEEARNLGIIRKDSANFFRRAVVIGFSRDGSCTRVVFDGLKNIYTLHNSFLRPIGNEEDIRFEKVPAIFIEGKWIPLNII